MAFKQINLSKAPVKETESLFKTVEAVANMSWIRRTSGNKKKATDAANDIVDNAEKFGGSYEDIKKYYEQAYESMESIKIPIKKLKSNDMDDFAAPYLAEVDSAKNIY